MRWNDRIDEMERTSVYTQEAWVLMADYETCLVGEALADVGRKMWQLPDVGIGSLRITLRHLGGRGPHGERGPVGMLSEKDWPALRARLAEIREVVAQHYPPPKLWEPSEQAAKSEPAEPELAGVR